MKILFWKHKKRMDKLDAIEREALRVHKNNIQHIATERAKVDKLNVALEENHIVFELAHVIGNR